MQHTAPVRCIIAVLIAEFNTCSLQYVPHCVDGHHAVVPSIASLSFLIRCSFASPWCHPSNSPACRGCCAITACLTCFLSFQHDAATSRPVGAVPVLGQAAQGISAGLGGVSTWLGTAGQSARQAARGLGVPGLDVGAGCGVLAGYYFGAGLMIKPSVVDQVARATTALAGAGGPLPLCGSGREGPAAVGTGLVGWFERGGDVL